MFAKILEAIPDNLTGTIRVIMAVLWGQIAMWLMAIGVEFTPEQNSLIEMGLTLAVSGAIYAGIRYLSQKVKWLSWLEWLLLVPKTPTYTTKG